MILRGDAGAKSPHEAVFGFRAKGGLMSVRYKNWKLIMPGKGAKDVDIPAELYNLTTDLGEQVNVASKHPDVVKKIIKIGNEADQAIKTNQPI